MMLGEDRKAVVAVDLGAQSCRVSLLRWNRGGPEITVVHRFANEPISTNEGLRWNLDAICEGDRVGLRACSRPGAGRHRFDWRGRLGRRLRAIECRRLSSRAAVLLSRRTNRTGRTRSSQPVAGLTALCANRHPDSAHQYALPVICGQAGRLRSRAIVDQSPRIYRLPLIGQAGE